MAPHAEFRQVPVGLSFLHGDVDLGFGYRDAATGTGQRSVRPSRRLINPHDRPILRTNIGQGARGGSTAPLDWYRCRISPRDERPDRDGCHVGRTWQIGERLRALAHRRQIPGVRRPRERHGRLSGGTVDGVNFGKRFPVEVAMPVVPALSLFPLCRSRLLAGGKTGHG
jgi:hypothetical protein